MPQIPSLRPFLKNKFLPFVLFFCMFGIVFIGLYIADNTFRITHIIIEPNNKRNTDLRGIQNIKGNYIFVVKESDIIDEIKIRNAYVKTVEVTKQYPDTLTLHISYYVPLAVLKVPDGYFLLGDEAVILEKNRTEFAHKLPHITYYQNIPFAHYQAGQQLDFKDIQDSLFYLQKLSVLKQTINSIDITGFHMLGLYTSEEVYLFSAEKERDQQVYQLEAVMREFMISGRKIKSLDVRFDKPVVVLE
ncbi:MAG TPA: FtsQ-type POTRA domain-containing protein [Candidatus Woesebacteria bacterium]|nr:FtsQ-type POTRA domain-containing protein [Candidatus Woesebacteria bacterium]